jgi:hypothetical protein
MGKISFKRREYEEEKNERSDYDKRRTMERRELRM